MGSTPGEGALKTVEMTTKDLKCYLKCLQLTLKVKQNCYCDQKCTCEPTMLNHSNMQKISLYRKNKNRYLSIFKYMNGCSLGKYISLGHLGKEFDIEKFTEEAVIFA